MLKKCIERSGWAAMIVALSLFAASRAATAQNVIHNEKFSNGNLAGWTLNAGWQITGAVATATTTNVCSSTVFGGDPGIDADGTAGGGILGYMMGGGGFPAYFPNAYTEAVSPVIPLQNGQTATLSFARWLNADVSSAADYRIMVLSPANVWTTIWSNGSTQTISNSWQTMTYDVTPYAWPGFKVKFTYQILNGCGVQTSWNIDNFVVTGVADEQIANGSFETAYGSTGSSTPVSSTASFGSGWQSLLGGYDIVSTYWVSSNGSKSIDLNGNAMGGISTTVRLRPQKKYGLVFDASVHPVMSSAAMNVSIAFPTTPALSTTTNAFTIANVGNTTSNMHWKLYGIPFDTMATNDPYPTATISFLSTTPGGAGVALDNVRLVEITEQLANGSFEQLNLGNPAVAAFYPFGSTSISAWTVTNGGVNRVTSYWPASNGLASIDLSGANQGELSQSVLLLANKYYKLEFDLAGNFDAPGVKTVETSAGDVSQSVSATTQTFNFDSTGHSAANMGWTPTTMIFLTPPAPGGIANMMIKLKSLTSSGYGPVVDNVRITPLPSGTGQPNSATASLKVNGFGPINANGPWTETIAGSSMTLDWQGAPNLPFILIASFVDTDHRALPPIGSLDLGTAIDFSDIFVIFDGTQLPGAFFYIMTPLGTASQTISILGITPGTEFAVQGLTQQLPSAASPFYFTAAHHLIRQ